MQLHIQTLGSNPAAFCALSCARDFEALFNTCNFTPNPISTGKSLKLVPVYNKCEAIQCMYKLCDLV